MAKEHSGVHGLRDGQTAGGGAGGMPPGDANNSNASGGYHHWHELGSKRPPGWGIAERKAPDSGSNLKAGGERPAKHDPAPGKMDPMRQVGTQTKPVGS